MINRVLPCLLIFAVWEICCVSKQCCVVCEGGWYFFFIVCPAARVLQNCVWTPYCSVSSAASCTRRGSFKAILKTPFMRNLREIFTKFYLYSLPPSTLNVTHSIYSEIRWSLVDLKHRHTVWVFLYSTIFTYHFSFQWNSPFSVGVLTVDENFPAG